MGQKNGHCQSIRHKFLNESIYPVKIIDRITSKMRLLGDIAFRLHKIQEALGRIETRQSIGLYQGNIQAVEFRTFSQWGEDGIIQFLLRNVDIKRKIFIEFGVQNYTESSTRFLLVNNNWSGLVIDGGEQNVAYIKNDPVYWQYNLKAECSFITRENINEIFLRNGISGEIGLLSVDIDGNDYWVWESITAVAPAIVVTEYNARFGSERAVTVPYDPGFVRSTAHHSHIYYGASLKALYLLARKKGYAFVGCNSAGNNAFFVRRDLLVHPLRELSVHEGYVPNQFREARSPDGKLAFLSREQEQELLQELPLVDIESGPDRV
jgi:hypothetical protein